MRHGTQDTTVREELAYLRCKITDITIALVEGAFFLNRVRKNKKAFKKDLDSVHAKIEKMRKTKACDDPGASKKMFFVRKKKQKT